MIGHKSITHRRIWLAVLLGASTVGMAYISDENGQSATAYSSEFGGTGGHDCFTFDAAGARLDNGSFVMFGQPLVGQTQNNDVTATFGGIVCLQAPDCPLQPGDFDGDDIVSLVDFGIFQLCFGSAPVGQCRCTDLNNDGAIDLIDFSIWISL